MFNLLPGQGLGFTASKELAFGLGAVAGAVITVPRRVPRRIKFASSPGAYIPPPEDEIKTKTHKITVLDNMYVNEKDEQELIELINIFIEAIDG